MNQPLNGRLLQWLKRPDPETAGHPQTSDFPAYVRNVLDPEEYLRANPDVAEAGVEPVSHWLNHGIHEGRLLAKGKHVILNADSGAERNGSTLYFEWNEQRIAVVDLESQFEGAGRLAAYGGRSQPEKQFIRFAADNFDREFYLREYPDVREAGIDPLSHFLENGALEGRRMAAGKSVHVTGEAEHGFVWGGKQVRIVDDAERRTHDVAEEVDLTGLSHAPTGDEKHFVRFVADHIDRELYLSENEDVRNDGADPLIHYLNNGVFEGRRLARDVGVRIEGGVRQFVWCNAGVTVSKVEVTEQASPVAHLAGAADTGIVTETASEDEFVEFVLEHLDRGAYLKAYPDVRQAGVDPVEHWLGAGIWEGRAISARVAITIGERAERRTVSPVRRFKWRGTTVSASFKRMSANILSQIMAQSRHDGAVVAAGANAIAGLREFDAIDLMARNDIDVRSIFSAIDERPDVVLITPFLCPGGAEKYVADLVDGLHEAGRGPIFVIVTEHNLRSAAGWEKLAILAPLKKARVLFWPDVFGPGHANPVFFARALNALKANTIVVNNSRLALDAVARFGRGLSKNARLFCTYFSHGVNALGAPYGARFPHRTMLFSTTLTDNGPMAALMGKMWGGLPSHPIVKLSAKLEPAGDATFATRLAARRQLTAHAHRQRRWVWVSRVERFKGTAVLAALARLRPREEFHLYGPVDGSLEELGLTAPNIIPHGTIADVTRHDFSQYDGFVFTSLFEGMPNVVLEMSQHAIPLVLADVGGLRETFSERAAMFVSHDDSSDKTAGLFSYALDTVRDMSPSAIADMVSEARANALEQHAPEVFRRAVKQLFDTDHV